MWHYETVLQILFMSLSMRHEQLLLQFHICWKITIITLLYTYEYGLQPPATNLSSVNTGSYQWMTLIQICARDSLHY